MGKKIMAALLAPIFLLLTAPAFINSFDVFADIPTISAKGILVSIRDEGSVTIDEKIYTIDPAARVINRKGKSVPLRSLPLPTAVRIEYMQAKTGFIIVLIEEVRNKEIKNKKGQR